MKIGLVHATTSSVESMKAIANQYFPFVNIVNFVDDNLLMRVNEQGFVDDKGFRTFLRLFFLATEGEVDGIIICCSLFCPLVPELQKYSPVPVIAIDSAMYDRAVCEGSVIGVVASNDLGGPTAESTLKKRAEEKRKEIKVHICTVKEAARALKGNDMNLFREVMNNAIHNLFNLGCDVIILSQITLAKAKGNQDLPDCLILTSPIEGFKNIIELIEEGAKD